MNRDLDEDEKQKLYGNVCPKCRITWTKTPRPVLVGFYWHCEVCKEKASKLVPPPLPEKENGSAYDAFQKMLDEDDIDWDDWSLF